MPPKWAFFSLLPSPFFSWALDGGFWKRTCKYVWNFPVSVAFSTSPYFKIHLNVTWQPLSPALCQQWENSCGPSLFGILFSCQSLSSDRIKKRYDFVRLSGFALLGWEQIYFILFFCIFLHVKQKCKTVRFWFRRKGFSSWLLSPMSVIFAKLLFSHL